MKEEQGADPYVDLRAQLQPIEELRVYYRRYKQLAGWRVPLSQRGLPTAIVETASRLVYQKALEVVEACDWLENIQLGEGIYLIDEEDVETDPNKAIMTFDDLFLWAKGMRNRIPK